MYMHHQICKADSWKPSKQARGLHQHFEQPAQPFAWTSTSTFKIRCPSGGAAHEVVRASTPSESVSPLLVPCTLEIPLNKYPFHPCGLLKDRQMDRHCAGLVLVPPLKPRAFPTKLSAWQLLVGGLMWVWESGTGASCAQTDCEER